MENETLISIPQSLDKNKLNFILELYWLGQLLKFSLIDRKEYLTIKNALEKKYNH